MSDEEKTGVRVVDRRWWARDADKPEGDARTTTKPTYVEELEQRLADAANQLQTHITEHRRSLDEFEQVKVRIRRDVAREVERGKRAVLVELLDVVDNLDRAIAAARETVTSPAAAGKDSAATPERQAADNLMRGVEMVRNQFLAKLEGFGVSRVPAVGVRFDARLHEAVTTAPANDPSQDGVVLAVIKEGYAIGDEVLRPASVVVGRYVREA